METLRLLLLATILIVGCTLTAQVAITTSGDDPDGSAMLDVQSSTKGFLPPRMTATEIGNIASPANGLFVYCTTDNKAYIFVSADNVWKELNYGAGTIAVLTVPDAPTIGTAIAGDSQASVLFTAPVNDGNSPITSYTATSTPGSFTGTLSQAGSGRITVTGLTNGTAYTFTVTATSAIGTSVASGVSNSVTPAVQTDVVTNPITEETWMDRNLGAIQVAASSIDSDAYGDLYQWGRAADGHQIRTSGTYDFQATSSAPTAGTDWYGKFITEGGSPYNWLTPQEDDLWQGENGTNNPCPSGYRLPSEAEWNAEKATWNSTNAAGAFTSLLKLPLAGSRKYNNGAFYQEGVESFYWTSTVSGTNSRFLNVRATNAIIRYIGRATGCSVRCIKD